MSSQRAVRSLLTNASLRSFSTIVDDRLAHAAAGSPLANSTDVFHNALNATAPRYNWTRDEIRQIYNTPLMELAHQAVC